MVLKKITRKTTGKKEWAIVSKTSKRPLQYFGARKPSHKRFMAAEKRIQTFKSFGSVPKVIKVKSYKRKGKLVKSHRKIIKAGIIPKKDRRVFDLLSTFPKERGGYLDFGKKNTGSLEKFDVVTGKTGEIELPDDYEAIFHTHPPFSGKTFEVIGTPSADDILAVIKSSAIQASIIFHKGKSFAVIETPKSKKLKKLSNKKILERYDLDDEADLIKQLKDDGFIVRESKKGKRISLPIKVK